MTEKDIKEALEALRDLPECYHCSEQIAHEVLTHFINKVAEEKGYETKETA